MEYFTNMEFMIKRGEFFKGQAAYKGGVQFKEVSVYEAHKEK